MEANDRVRCLVLLRRLAEMGMAKATAEKAAGTLKPGTATVSRHTTTEISYSPKLGMTSRAGKHCIVTRELWGGAAGQIAKALEKEPEAAELLAKTLEETPERAELSRGVQSFRLRRNLGRLIEATLKGEPLSEAEAEEWRKGFLDGPKRPRTFESHPELQVVGLVVQDEPFSLQLGNYKLTFRRPAAADFCYEETVGFRAEPASSFVDAFVKVEGECESDDFEKNEKELNAIAEWANGIMRLAIPSGVAITAAIYRDTEFGGLPASMYTTDEPGHKNPPARVGLANVARFTKLCEMLSNRFGRELAQVEQTRVNHLAIAFHRYMNGLSDVGLVESRIAEAVMGIESLFMTDKDVINFKLSIRLPKLLGFVGVNPVEAKALIADGYTIRSKYVHGDALKPKELRKVVEPHGGMEEMLGKLLLYLRNALVLCLFALPEKTKRVSLIDHALIDPAKHDELCKAIEPYRELLEGAEAPVKRYADDFTSAEMTSIE
jgi:hypothetical protein